VERGLGRKEKDMSTAETEIRLEFMQMLANKPDWVPTRENALFLLVGDHSADP
jgi:hypothetical protein